jgi:hypothetical protein
METAETPHQKAQSTAGIFYELHSATQKQDYGKGEEKTASKAQGNGQSIALDTPCNTDILMDNED